MKLRAGMIGLAVTFLAACGVGWKDQGIQEVIVSEDGRTLEVGWHCHPDASVEASESGDQVRLTFRTYDQSKGDCADTEVIRLDAPIGDREVIDAETGEPLRAVGGNCYTSAPSTGCQS